MEMGKQMELDGKALLTYCTEQQKIEREAQKQKAEEPKATREAERLAAEQKAKREVEEHILE